MTEYPSFGKVLAELMDRRDTAISTVAERATIEESDLQEILNGAAPDETHLRRIAPTLGLHAADLFAIAWLDLPDDLAPLDLRAEYPLYHLAAYASRLSPEQGRELHEHANQMPQEQRNQPYKLPAPFNKFRHDAGGVLLRLFANRNLPRFAAYAIMGTTGRPL